ncbi:MAG: efflux transporter periplasmic adaptor subunit, partial [Phycisphaerales bacterium]
GDKWLVSSGLSVGDRVITEGMQKVRPGAAVKVASAESKPAEGPKPAASPESKPVEETQPAAGASK